MVRSKIYGKKYKYVEPLTDTEQLVQILNKMTVKELTKILKDNNLPTTGKRNDLLIRSQENGLLPLYPIIPEKKELVNRKFLYGEDDYNPLKGYDQSYRRLDYVPGNKKEEAKIKKSLGVSLNYNRPQYLRPSTRRQIIPTPFQRMEPPPSVMIDVEDVPIKYLDDKPTPRKRKIHKYKVEATLRPERRATKANKDPADITTWPLPDLKDFMREHGIKGLSKRKAEIIDIILQYIS
jgi:hypothetical protein